MLKIDIQLPWVKQTDIYSFTCEFAEWFEGQLNKHIKESKAFREKRGAGWTLYFRWDTGRRIKKPQISEPGIDRRNKEMGWLVDLPAFRCTSPNPKAYVPVLRQFLKSFVIVLKGEQLDTSGIERETEALLKRFKSKKGMLYCDEPYEPEETVAATAAPKPKAPVKLIRRKLPKWKIPANIQKRVDDEGGIWESERWDPILLSVMSGTSYSGRDIPLAWQIEFEPDDERFQAANEKISAIGIEPDGDGWSSLIEKIFARRHPKNAGELHFDSESSTCVAWVESENVCRRLIEVVWALMNLTIPLPALKSGRGRK
jgi:hypothetical protein